MAVRKLTCAFIVIVALLALTACDGLSLFRNQKSQQLTLKVLYPSASGFERTWGASIREALPHVTFQVIAESPNGDRELETLIREEKPDLIYMGSAARYNELAELGALAPLDSWITLEQSLLNELYQPAIEHLELQQRQLFGLPVQFDAKLLFFNKTLFDAYQVPHPYVGISWHEAMALADRFAGQQYNSNIVYGLEDYDWDESPYNPFLLVERIALSRGMYFFDSNGRSAIHTKEWSELLGQAADAFARGSFFMPERSDLLYDGQKVVNHYVKDKPFLAGRTAMALHGVSMFGFLFDLDHYEGLEAEGLDWGVVPAPVDPGNSGATTNVVPVHIFGIHSDSPLQDEAWEVIRFLTGEAFAEAASDLGRFDSKYGERLPIRPQYIRMDDIPLTSFTRQSLDMTGISLYRTVDPDKLEQFRLAAGERLREVIRGSITAEEALEGLQHWSL